MSRPTKCKKIYFDIEPQDYCFGPKMVPMKQLEKVTLSLEELQAIKFADLEGLYHDKAGAVMGISRQTFGNLVKSARKKITDSIINKKVLIIEDSGNTVISKTILPKCKKCCVELGSADCINDKKLCPKFNNK